MILPVIAIGLYFLLLKKPQGTNTGTNTTLLSNSTNNANTSNLLNTGYTAIKPQTSIMFPSQLSNDTGIESGFEWNFGFISKTQKAWAGELPSSSPYKKFSNRFSGLGATIYLLTHYINNLKLNTIEKIGSKWASPQNQSKWINAISGYTGFDKTQNLEANTLYLPQLAYAIAVYGNPNAVNYISDNTIMVAMEYAQKNYKINILV